MLIRTAFSFRGRCCQYHGGLLYVFLISYLRVLAVPPITWGPFIRISYFVPEGIFCVAIHRGPSDVSLLSMVRVLAVPPISRGPSNVYVLSYPMGIGGAANTRKAPHGYIYFQTRGYWRYCQYPGGSSYVSLLSYVRDIGGVANILWAFILFCSCL